MCTTCLFQSVCLISEDIGCLEYVGQKTKDKTDRTVVEQAFGTQSLHGPSTVGGKNFGLALFTN